MDTPQNIEVIREKAAEWLTRIHDDEVDEAARAEFSDWLTEHPSHGDEFAAVSSVWAAMDEVESAQQIKLQNAVQGTSVTRSKIGKRSIFWALAASLLMAVVLTMPIKELLSPSPTHFVTQVGESKTVYLDDGSIVHLNTRSELVWHGDGDSERRAELLSGEALFDVKPDPDRPFLVEAGSGVIRVLGTRFNVYRKKDSEVVVTVLEGKVQVQDASPESVSTTWKRSLIANQEVSFRETGVKEEVIDAPAYKKVSWRDGIIILDDLPLWEVIDELSRYSSQRIVIADSRLNEIRIGGVIEVADIQQALDFLKDVAPVQVAKSDGVYVLKFKSGMSE